MNQQQLQSRSQHSSSQQQPPVCIHKCGSGSQSSLLALLQLQSEFKAKPITIEGLSVVKWPERCCVKTVKVNKR